MSGLGADVIGGGLDIHYDAEVQKDSFVDLQLIMYSKAAWEFVKGQTHPLPPDAVAKPVTILGQPTELVSVPAGTRPVNTLSIQVTLGDTVLRVSAGSGGVLTPGGPDANPLVDEATFLAVMQNLRPYPE